MNIIPQNEMILNFRFIIGLFSKRKETMILIIFIVFSGSLVSQSEKVKKPSTYALLFYGGTGISKQTSQSTYGKAYITPLYTLGIQWRPNHLLSIGIESGYANIEKKTEENVLTEYGTTLFNASLSEMPIVLIYNMRIEHIDISGGLGISNVISRIEAFNTQTKTNRWFYTYYAAIGVNFPVKSMTFLVRANLFSFEKLNKTIAGVGLLISYDFVKW